MRGPLLLGALGCLVALTHAQPHAYRMPVADVDGVFYGVGPARGLPLGSAQTGAVSWRHDGQAALVIYRELSNDERNLTRLLESFRQRLVARQVIGVWNRRTNQLVRHLTTQGGMEQIRAATWLPTSSLILSELARFEADLREPFVSYSVAPAGQKPIFEFTTGPGRWLSYAIDDNSGMLALVTSVGSLAEGVQSELRVLDPATGKWLQPSAWPGSNLLIEDIRWVGSSGKLFLNATGIKGQSGWTGVFDVRNGSFGPRPSAFEGPTLRAEGERYIPLIPPISVTNEFVRFEGQLMPRLRLEFRRENPAPGQPKTVPLSFALGAVRPVMAPTYDGVLFEQNGTLLFSDILKLDAEKLKEPDIELRNELMNRAKQIGVAFILYASDHDGKFPPPGELPQSLMPYVRRSDIFDGFVFTTVVINQDGVDDPSKEELGHFRVPGGRIVAFLDGSTRWVSDR